MTVSTSQPSALNPIKTESEIQGVTVLGTRTGFEQVTVTGTNAPRDAQNLEGIIVTGTKRKKTDPRNLYYPNAIADPTSEFKNAVQFIAYEQNNAFENISDGVPLIKQVPETFRANPSAPFTTGGATAAFLILNDSVRTLSGPFGSAASIVADLAGISAGGLAFFSSGETSNYGRRTKRISQTITLYMPDTLVNQERHDYQPVSLTQASGKAGLYSQLLNGSNIGKIEVAAELAGRSQILGTRATEAILAGFGYALNPMLEMIYGGTQPREFQFQFRFSPRNKKEADDVLRIIRTFRFHAATEAASADIDRGSGTGLRYVIPPNHFEIQFLRRVNGKFQENLALPRISTCMLAGINTNYAAQLDTFSTTPDGIPTSISLDLSFVESVVLTKTDINNGY